MSLPFVGEAIQIGFTVLCNVAASSFLTETQCNWVGIAAHEIGEPLLEALAAKGSKALYYGTGISLDLSAYGVAVFMRDIVPVALLSWFGSDIVAHDKNRWVKLATGFGYSWLGSGAVEEIKAMMGEAVKDEEI